MRKSTLAEGLIPELILGIVVLVGSVNASQGQKINPKLPSVYLTFREFVPKTSTQPSQGARLVLHNNTRWPLRYGEWLEPTPPGDSAIIYTTEVENGCFGETRRHLDVVTERKLLPGKTVTFTVPREDFPPYSKIFVEVGFLWELVKGERVRDEVVHRAYFLSIDLPRWPQ